METKLDLIKNIMLTTKFLQKTCGSCVHFDKDSKICCNLCSMYCWTTRAKDQKACWFWSK
jgi:hypothetical protein